MIKYFYYALIGLSLFTAFIVLKNIIRAMGTKSLKDSKLNLSRVSMHKGDLPMDLFIKTHFYVFRYDMNDAALMTFQEIFQKIYGDDADFELFRTLTQDFNNWKNGFEEELIKSKDILSKKDKMTLMSCIYVLASGDGNKTNVEEHIMNKLREDIELSEDDYNKSIEYAKEQITLVA